MNTKMKTYLKGIFIAVFFNIFILSILPVIVRKLLLTMGITISSDNLTHKYLMGIFVRILGVLIAIYIIKKEKLIKTFSYKITIKTLLIGFLFYIYIGMNIEIVNLGNVSLINIVLMIIDALFVGVFEELLFRGLLLLLFLREYKQGGKYYPVIISSLIFGLVHLLNLFTNPDEVEVFIQVVYAFMIAVFFSGVFIRTRYNILYVIILHALYDIAAGFEDFKPKSVAKNAEISGFISIIIMFMPLFLYGLFLIRKKAVLKVEKVPDLL